jgi:hypothetical protein
LSGGCTGRDTAGAVVVDGNWSAANVAMVGGWVLLVGVFVFAVWIVAAMVAGVSGAEDSADD